MTSASSLEPVATAFYYRPVVRTFKVKSGGIAGFLCSIGFHIVLLLVSGIALIKPVDFAVDQGFTGMDLQLVTGVEELVTKPAPVAAAEPVEPIGSWPPDVLDGPQEIIPIAKEILRPEQLTVKEPQKLISAEVKPMPLPQVAAPEAIQPVDKGNGSVSMTSQGNGALTEVQPVYLSNPAPKYPAEARRKGWEGTVVLRASIDKDGYPFKLELEKSSGYKILDEEARKSVATWQFRPAHIGDMPIESSARVPVRFEIKG